MRRLNKEQMTEALRLNKSGVHIQTLAYKYEIDRMTMAKYLRQFEKGVVEEWA